MIAIFLKYYIFRGAPHLHSLLWLQDIETKKAPSSFWNVDDLKESNLPEDIQDFLKEACETEEPHLTENNGKNKKMDDQSINERDKDTNESISDTVNKKEEEKEEKRKKIAAFASKVVFGSTEDARCNQHRKVASNENSFQKCEKCQTIRERVESYNTHGCSFTCHKKKQMIIIHKNEGHGRLDKIEQVGAEKMEIPKCRFDIPFFPIDKTIFLEGRTKENIIEDEELRKQEEFEHLESKQDLKKLENFYSDNHMDIKKIV